MIQLDLLAVALHHVSIVGTGGRATYKRNGIHARANQPDLVPSGGELPQTMSVPGQ